LRRFGLESTVRASLAFYNLPEDLEALARVLCDLTASKIPAAR
jgi:selenocysteine lyase/cysteine desulfurase